jgi:hypothetical protein
MFINPSLFLIDGRQVRIKPLAMPRKLRVELPDARYHIMSRGDRREDIFLDDVDRPRLSKLALRLSDLIQISLRDYRAGATSTSAARSGEPIFGNRNTETPIKIRGKSRDDATGGC